MPTETVTEKMECVNGSVRRLLPLSNLFPNGGVFAETRLSEAVGANVDTRDAKFA